MSPTLDSRSDTEKVIRDEILLENVTADSTGLVDNVDITSEASKGFGSSESRAEQERRLVRKVDMRLLPMVVIIYIINYIDRVAITAARLKGLEKDLGLSDIQYDAVVAILYATYCPAQIPSNMIMSYVKRPSWYMGGCAMLWGLISMLTGVTHNFCEILACRFFLGLPEAAFYPGSMYLLSRWYTKKELTFRSAILYSGLLISNAFGSLLAAGILSGMEGKRGIRGWRWLFLLEGGLTICIGALAMWILPDYPSGTRWLSPEDRSLAQARLAEDAGEADEDREGESFWNGLKLAFRDIKAIIFAVMHISVLFGLSFINFFPTLTSTLGFNAAISLLLAAPPWVFATIVNLLNSYHADKTGERFFHLVIPLWGTIIGYIIAISTPSIGGRYVSMFLMASGWAGSAITLVWVSNAIPRPPAKRAVALAMASGIGNIGNLLGSFSWKAKWGPAYHQSMFIGIAALAFGTCLTFGIRYILARENKKGVKDGLDCLTNERRGRIEEFARLEGISFDEALEKNQGIRYLL